MPLTALVPVGAQHRSLLEEVFATIRHGFGKDEPRNARADRGPACNQQRQVPGYIKCPWRRDPDFVHRTPTEAGRGTGSWMGAEPCGIRPGNFPGPWPSLYPPPLFLHLQIRSLRLPSCKSTRRAVVYQEWTLVLYSGNACPPSSSTRRCGEGWERPRRVHRSEQRGSSLALGFPLLSRLPAADLVKDHLHVICQARNGRLNGSRAHDASSFHLPMSLAATVSRRARGIPPSLELRRGKRDGGGRRVPGRHHGLATRDKTEK